MNLTIVEKIVFKVLKEDKQGFVFFFYTADCLTKGVDVGFYISPFVIFFSSFPSRIEARVVEGGQSINITLFIWQNKQ